MKDSVEEKVKTEILHWKLWSLFISKRWEMWNLMIDWRLPQNFQFVPESYCSDRMCWTGENDKIVKMTSRDCSIPPRRPWAIIDCIHYLVEFLLSWSSTSCSNANYLCNGKRIIVTLMPLLCIVVLHERFRAIDSATFFCFIMRANLLLWNKIFIQLWILHRYPLSYEHFMVSTRKKSSWSFTFRTELKTSFIYMI